MPKNQTASGPLQLVLEKISTPVALLNPSGELVWGNDALCTWSGSALEDLLGHGLSRLNGWALCGDDVKRRVDASVKRAAASGETVFCNLPSAADNSEADITVKFSRPLPPEGGGRSRLILAEILPSRLPAVDKPRPDSAEERYRALFEHTRQGIAVFRPIDGGRDFIIRDLNPAAERIDKVAREEVIGRPVTDAFPGIEELGLLEILRRVWRTGRPQHLPFGFYRDAQREGWRDNVVVKLSGGELVALFEDVTRNRQMKTSELPPRTELQNVFHTPSVGIRLIDLDFNIIRMNRSMERLSRSGGDQAVGQKCHQVFGGPFCHGEVCPLRRIMKGEKRVEFEVQKSRSDGSQIPCRLSATPMLNEKGQLIGIVESFEDIRDRKRMERALQMERRRLRRILSNLVEGAGIINPDYLIEYQNEILVDRLGNHEGEPCFVAYRRQTAPCPQCFMREAVESGKLQRCEFSHANNRIYEQSYIPFRDVDGSHKVIVLLKDITEQKASLAAAMRSEQLASIGELAAGVAHEINNPINGIINYAQLILDEDADGLAAKEIAPRIIHEGDRVARIVESLLSFARHDHDDRAAASIAEILEDSLALTGAQLRKDGIRLQLSIPGDLPSILAHKHKIQQVFVNLISNAGYALKHKSPAGSGERCLKIRVTQVELDKYRFLRISFRDNGTGIREQQLNQVLNPFFSTKPKGRGTGLGLSISHGIVTDHGGRLSINSEEGRFTEVTVDLPVAATLSSNGPQNP